MNYRKQYEKFINECSKKTRIKLNKNNKSYVYYEKHHIIPKCIGGSNNEDNLILLTAKEHYVAHKLLSLIYINNKKIQYAFYKMSFDKKINREVSSKEYAKAQEFMSKPENNGMFGKKHSAESIKKMKSIPKSEETKQKFSKARKGKSYDEFYGEKSSLMRQKRKEQTSGAGNPNAGKYIIHNKKINKFWYCSGNLSKFCAYYHVSNKTLRLSRKNNIYINDWKCIFTNEIPSYCEIFNI